MKGAVATELPGGRLHLNHGPIDLVISVESDQKSRCLEAARLRFSDVLEELVEELELLRKPLGQYRPSGRVAKRMAAAVLPFSDRFFVTPMAAVAGAVADEILGEIVVVDPEAQAIVNNGGDIAINLPDGGSARALIVSPGGTDLGTVTIRQKDGIGGLATSGRGGRSFSFGIADAVTVLARSAAQADVAATLIANAVDLPGDTRIQRSPASTLQADSDLGDRLVVVGCDALAGADARTALAPGAGLANELMLQGEIVSAALFLQGETETINWWTPVA